MWIHMINKQVCHQPNNSLHSREAAAWPSLTLMLLADGAFTSEELDEYEQRLWHGTSDADPEHLICKSAVGLDATSYPSPRLEVSSSLSSV